MPTALITGGHGGIGYECARQLAVGPGFNLILAGRDLTRVEPAAQRLRTEYGVQVTALQMDTSSLASVREAAARCRAMVHRGEVDALQAILCNAGARIGAVNYTPDGYEETFATNYLGHFLLIELLIDCIDENGRVVFTASGTHDPETMDGKLSGAVVEPNAIALANDGKDGRKPTSAGKRYSTSKLCNILHAYELDRRLRRSGSSIASIAFDPGSTAGTGFVRGMPRLVQWLSTTAFSRWLQKRLGVTMGDVEFSGRSLGEIAADPVSQTLRANIFNRTTGGCSEYALPKCRMTNSVQLASGMTQESWFICCLARSPLCCDDNGKETCGCCGSVARLRR